ncbi:unnamed protein product [Schistosoma turkestanicum]|nr:unnamed protein product [Schistosoma turkestanicum]
MLQSELLVRCYDIVNIVDCPSVLEDLDSFIPYANVNEVQTGLPPFSTDQIKKRITGLHLPYGTGIFTIRLPDYQPRFGYRRSGIVLRQVVIKGEVESLFVAGVEHGSPASNATDLQMGDRIYSISGYPLDWHTLEQLRYKLIHLDGLAPNSNIYDLANYLLNRAYQNIGNAQDHHHNLNKNSSIFKVPSEPSDSTIFEPPILVIIRYPKSNSLWSNQTANGETNELQTKPNKKPLSCYETVLENEDNDIGLGLQIGSNQDNTEIHIVSIFKNSQAEKDGVLKEGDRVVEVNYQTLEGLTANQALKKVKSICRNTKYVQIKCARNLQTDNHVNTTNNHLISSSNDRHEQSENSKVLNNVHDPALYNEDVYEISTDEKSVLTRTPTLILSASDTSINASEEETVLFYNCKFNKPGNKYLDKTNSYDQSLLKKWLDIFSPDVELLLVHYDITNSNCGLGIGIEDTILDDEMFGESQHHHYIVEINPEGPIAKDQTLSIGDELLEINDVIIVNKDNSEIASIFHTIPTEGYLICARYPNESSQSDVKGENGNDELVLASVVPFTRTLSDGEIPTVDFNGQDMDNNSFDETNSGSKQNFAVTSLDSEAENDEHAGSDVDEDRHPIKLLSITLKSQSSSFEHQTEDMQNNKMRIENFKPKMNKDNLATDSRKSTRRGSLTRLPMAAKLAKSMEKLPCHETSSQVSGSIFENNNPNRDRINQLNEITNNNYDVLTVKVLKKAGEILGLELELENGDARGITLAHITPGSPVDRLKYLKNYKTMDLIDTNSNYSKLSKPLTNDDDLRIPCVGDRILGVSDYSFQNMSAFTALRLLRKLISYSGIIKIRFIPKEYLGSNQLKYNSQRKMFPSEPNLFKN